MFSLPVVLLLSLLVILLCLIVVARLAQRRERAERIARDSRLHGSPYDREAQEMAERIANYKSKLSSEDIRSKQMRR